MTAYLARKEETERGKRILLCKDTNDDGMQSETKQSFAIYWTLSSSRQLRKGH